MPPGTQMSKSVWVEGVGDQLQLYKTAKLPVTIMGQKTELLAAIAPIHHIPFAVVLGRNVPGLKHTWTMEITDNTNNGGDQEVGGAGEWASQVVLESASSPVPGSQKHPTVTGIMKCKHGDPQHPTEVKLTTKTADLERQDRQQERKASKCLPTSNSISPYMDEANQSQSSVVNSQPNMEMQQHSVQEDTVTEDIATVVAMAVETRRQKLRKEKEEAANAQATLNSGVQLTPIGGRQVQEQTTVNEAEDTAADRGSSMEGDPQQMTSEEAQQPLPLSSPTEEAGSSSPDQMRASLAPEQPTPTPNKEKKKTSNKQAKKTAVGERRKPTMELSRKVLKKLQLADEELGPILRGETDKSKLYSIEDGVGPC